MRIGANPVDQRPHARSLFTRELVVLEVDVVNNLSDHAERGIIEPRAGQEDFKAAAIALMGELGVEHVEAQFPRRVHVTLHLDKSENGVSVDKAAYQPGTGDAIDMHALTRAPTEDI